MSIYEMSLHQTITIDNIDILRVSGGWIYTFSLGTWRKDAGFAYTSVFVPFNNEYMNRDRGIR